MVSVSAGAIAIYNTSSQRGRSKSQRSNEVNLRENDTRGEISKKATKRICKAIDWMLYLAKEKKLYPDRPHNHQTFRLNMVTLTMASTQVHSDNEIKSKLLNQFLIEMCNKWGVVRYMWRAESQGNGNIHFHIITDKFIPYYELHVRWCRIQNKLGYVDRFKEKHGHRNPPSTDIHAIWKIKNLSAYLAKYCAKESKYRKIQGKQWGLSTALSQMKNYVCERWSKLEDDIHKVFVEFKEKVKRYDYATVIWVKIEDWIKLDVKYLAELVE